jgi:4-hydroxy-3-methylbut-2-enyl diphosphate reductase
MQIFVEKNIGFCQGVERAVNLAKEAALKHGKVYALGQIIHNQRTVDELESLGVITVENVNFLVDSGQWTVDSSGISSTENCQPSTVNLSVLIRSHGITKTELQKLGALNANVVDATCESVKTVRERVQRFASEGYFIILFGKKTHPEVLGIVSFVNNYAVIENLDSFKFDEKFDKFLVLSQTTFSYAKFLEFSHKLREMAKTSLKTVVIHNTICYTTMSKQASALAVAKKADCVFVIGDKNSSNTTKLFEIAGAECKRVYLISNISELNLLLNSVLDIKTISKLGIIAGASVCKELITEVINIMDVDNKADIIVEEGATVAKATATETKEKKAVKKDDAPMDMATAMKKYGGNQKMLREGMRVKCVVISADQNGVSVSIDGTGKNDSGYIEKAEVELDGSYNAEDYPAGTEVDAVVIPKTDAKNKAINLSKKAYDAIKIEDEAVKKIMEGEEFSLTCNQAIKGGLLGRIGTYTVFVPASQLRIGYVQNLDEYLNKKLRLRMLPALEEKVIETEDGEDAPKHRQNPKRIVASQRVILEEERKDKEEAFWEVMQVNNIIGGKVKRFTPFGAFVSIMGFDCLAHISDISWTKINDPSEVLGLNKSYDFVVLKADKESGKVSLGYKQLQKRPYELAKDKYNVGDVIKGKVERVKDFGAFVQIEPGIDGLVHVSEIGHKWISNANEALKVGDEVEAKIMSFDNNKITLSMKELVEAPVEVEEEVKDETGEKPTRFNKKAAATDASEPKKRTSKRGEKEVDDGPREYVSNTAAGATFGDLLKGLDMSQFDKGDK